MWFFKSSETSKLSDPEIVSLYKTTGDKKLVGILFDRHAHLVYGICYHYLKNKEQCKDAVLTLFEKLFDDLYKYDVVNFSSWMHSVARNYCFAVLKKEKSKISLEEIDDLKEEKEDPEISVSIEKSLKNLNGALQTINEEQKKCVALFYLKNKSYTEISGVTGFSLNQVKSYIQNGKRNLKIYLEKMRTNEKQD
jgi:RNA polymerase sigma-70 factor, ECF subfamily